MSYNYTNPSKKSGLNKKIKISGSEVLESYFNYSIESYDVNFGYNSKEMFEKVPVLHYNVQLRRMLLNAFITYLIPIAVVLLMLFFLINTTTKSEESQGIIESMAAFAFVLVFSHIDMRKEIVTADLIYIEFFYFATYLLIVWTTFNLLTYAKAKHSIFDFYDNLISKATFFPIFYILILFITLYKFYWGIQLVQSENSTKEKINFFLSLKQNNVVKTNNWRPSIILFRWSILWSR